MSACHPIVTVWVAALAGRVATSEIDHHVAAEAPAAPVISRNAARRVSRASFQDFVRELIISSPPASLPITRQPGNRSLSCAAVYFSQRTGVSHRAVEYLSRQRLGEIPCYRFDTQLRFDLAEIRTWWRRFHQSASSHEGSR